MAKSKEVAFVPCSACGRQTIPNRDGSTPVYCCPRCKGEFTVPPPPTPPRTREEILREALEKIREGTCECSDSVSWHRHRMEPTICERTIAREAIAEADVTARYPGEGTAWADFLNARARVLEEWRCAGKSSDACAREMAMDAAQVRLIWMTVAEHPGEYGVTARTAGKGVGR